MTEDWTLVGYIAGAVLFILGIKGLARPRTAVRANLLGATGMLVAVVVTLVANGTMGIGWILGGLALGGALGVVAATQVRMTAMPELVALFNGFGGGASVLVAVASYTEATDIGGSDVQLRATAALAAFIGAVTLTGSLVAFTKLRDKLKSAGFTGVQIVSAVLTVVAAVFGVLMVADPGNGLWVWLLVAVAAVLGVIAVLPIGGADMPVVIALLNSMSGLAAAAAGFVLENPVLIIAGALVGASGLILTQIMCAGMNRSLPAVLFKPTPAAARRSDGADPYEGNISATSPEEVAMLLETATRVAIVPGYGLAVAQAQHAVRDLTRRLTAMDVEVVFGIHPVAGRMPGHMNVLLAEAEIDYQQLLEMDDINPTFDSTDLTIVLGANDVVNPAARTDPNSPIAGMPILEVDASRVVVVVKRSLSPGFAGIPNPLFAGENTLMLFADGRQAVVDITHALREM